MRLLLLSLLVSRLSFGFCGFYVAKADASLFNRASQVILVRDGNRTALTMANDFKGELSEFAMVVPVPEVLTREQIHVGDRKLIERVDNFSAPRLVEYFDDDPCNPTDRMREGGRAMMKNKGAGPEKRSGGAHGVTVEARYTVGEYDILILSAKESGGLETWLLDNGYKLPKNASKALGPYIKQNMKFFVARVNLKEQEKTGFTFLRPIQIAFESPKFMLPIRLGMVNADGPQDLLIYTITKKGRVETTNYRTVKLPTGMNVPIYIKEKFADFYRATFDTAHVKENKKVLFLEYAWNMGWCDPCAADPLSRDELRKLGVFWLADADESPAQRRRGIRPRPGNGIGPVDAFITRLHVRYDGEHFPEDLMFQETGDSENFQGRYVLQHPWTGKSECKEAEAYRERLATRRKEEAKTLASLTGWNLADITKAMGDAPNGDTGKKDDTKWYQNIFK